MKAERRHELKTNALARGLEGFPEYARLYGNRVLIGLILVLALVWVVRYRSETTRQSTARAREDLNGARRAVDSLDNAIRAGSVERIAAFRNEQAQEASDKVREAQGLTDDPTIRAQSYLILGDLYWKLANFPELPGAATRPDELGLPKLGSAAPMSRDELLKKAESAYGEALRSSQDDPLTADLARLNLGVVAENKKDWDAASRFYQEVIDASRDGKGLKPFAELKLKNLDALRKPPLLATAETQPSAAPPGAATQPLTAALGPPAPLLPTSGPATAPATAPTSASLAGPTTPPAATSNPQ